MKNYNWRQQMEEDIKECTALGWTVARYSDIHYRIWEQEFDIAVDVWPSASKWWGLKSGKKSSFYSDLIKTLDTYFYNCKKDVNNFCYRVV
jgi:hypothetical protein